MILFGVDFTFLIVSKMIGQRYVTIYKKVNFFE